MLLPWWAGPVSEQNLSSILHSFQGLDEELQQEGILLGQFTYDQDGEPIQTFYFQVEDCYASRGSELTFPSFQQTFSEH